jgi:hypothetical protein
MLVRNLALLALMTVSTPAMAIEMFTNFQNGESLGGDPVGTYSRSPAVTRSGRQCSRAWAKKSSASSFLAATA